MREHLAIVFLILLRVAIGWHFFFEGYEKYHSVSLGPTETNRFGQTVTNRPWSSENYFREAQGPMAVAMRWKIGDPDEQSLAKLTAADSSKIPPVLEQEWNDYFQRFAKRYGLDADQRTAAEEKLNRQKERTAAWFTTRLQSPQWLLAGLWSDTDRKPFKHVSPFGTIDVNQSVAERVEDYRAKLAEYRNLLHDRPEALGRDVETAHRNAVRGELIALRAELVAMLDGRTAEMKESLASVLTPEQASTGPVPEPAVGWRFWFMNCTNWRFITYIDWITRWSLVVIGAGLMLGLFSRTSALGGALFLVMTVLTTPSLPWLPEPPNAEGHYLYISKNVIEMLALFMLACVPSGRWFGLDSLICAMNPWRKKRTTI